MSGALSCYVLLARRQKQRRRWSASLDANVNNHGEDGQADEDADADGDTDHGVWPGELVVRLSSSLSRKRSRRWRWSGRGLRRRWSILLVLRSLLAPLLSCDKKKHNGWSSYETTIITCTFRLSLLSHFKILYIMLVFTCVV